eukprot:766585-Hanusia_phi.AAC.2
MSHRLSTLVKTPLNANALGLWPGLPKSVTGTLGERLRALSVRDLRSNASCRPSVSGKTWPFQHLLSTDISRSDWKGHSFRTLICKSHTIKLKTSDLARISRSAVHPVLSLRSDPSISLYLSAGHSCTPSLSVPPSAYKFSPQVSYLPLPSFPTPFPACRSSLHSQTFRLHRTLPLPNSKPTYHQCHPPPTPSNPIPRVNEPTLEKKVSPTPPRFHARVLSTTLRDTGPLTRLSIPPPQDL